MTFFFSSRRRHTRSLRDWSSDVCSSDLATEVGIKPIIGIEAYIAPASRFETKRILWGDPSQKGDDVSGSGSYTHLTMVAENATGLRNRSEERRVGKESRSRWSPYH